MIRYVIALEWRVGRSTIVDIIALGGGLSPSCDGRHVVMLDGRIVTSVILALVCTGWRRRRRLALGICHGRCHAPNTFGTVNMECTVDSRLSWSEQ